MVIRLILCLLALYTGCRSGMMPRRNADRPEKQAKEKLFQSYYEQTFVFSPLLIIRNSTAKKNKEIIQIIMTNTVD